MGEDETIEGILDAARYLRGVRPIDPAELTDYVIEDVDPATVADVLADHAVALGIRRRSDGTFVPVADGPAKPDFDGVEDLPDRITAAIEAGLIEHYGSTWFAGGSGDRLREAIRSFKSAYLAGESVTYDLDAAWGYAIYHLPGTYAKSQYVLDVLGRSGRIPNPLRALEVGTGIGGVALGMSDYLGDAVPVDYHGVEPSENAIAVADRLLERTHRNFRWHLERSRVESTALEGTYDLVVLANVLGELENPGAVVEPLLEFLDDDGSLVMLEPADERTSRLLRRVERELADEHEALEVYAPALRLWPEATPTDDCWSFDRRPSIDVPPFQRALDEGAREQPGERDPATGEFVNTELRYAYSILRPDGHRVAEYRPTRSRFAPLAETNDHVGDRVNLAVVKLSHSLAEEDRHPLYVIGDGSQSDEHFAVHTRPTSLNEPLGTANYGDILEIQSGLVLWNEDEAAYNIVVDAETIVDRVPTREGTG